VKMLLASMLLVLSTGCAKWRTDDRIAGGEWKVEVQTPPCDSVHNIQVIYPQESGYPITIECDSMPVAEAAR
jgi:hypothetical protein